MKWRILAMARMLGYHGDHRLFGVEVPLRLVPSVIIRQQLDAGSYEAKEARFIQEYLPPGSEVLELGASLGIVSSVILGRRPSRLVSYEAVPCLADIARQMVAHNHPDAPWELVQCAIADEGVSEVSFAWSPEYTQGGSVARDSGEGEGATLRVPAASLSGVIERHGLKSSAWLVMDIEGMEWELARRQAAGLRHFAGIIVECHDITDGGRHVPHALVLEEITRAGFDIVDRQDRVAVLMRRRSRSAEHGR
jgi:FkbM family methyltransferase